MDKFLIGGKELDSRLFIGTGKYGHNKIIPEVIKQSGAQVITMAIRRIDFDNKEENILEYIPKDMILLPNTSGARTADEAIRIARISKAMRCGNWIKIEVINDNKYLMPDNLETLKATEVLAKEGFVVLPYMSPDLAMGQRMVDAGAAAVMPLGSPIGSNRGIETKGLIEVMIDEIDIPIIVDAGIGRPSDANYAMEMGASAVLVNTAIASSKDPVVMGEAFKLAVQSGRKAFLSGLGTVTRNANASSPLTHFLREGE